MKEAFSYMFKEKNFIIKALPYGLFTFVVQFLMLWAFKFVSPQTNTIQPQYFLLVILACIFTIIPIGFMYSSLKAILEQIELPFMNIKRDFIFGLKFIAGWIIFMLAYVLIVLSALLIVGVPIVMLTKTNPVLGAISAILSVVAYFLVIFLFFAYIPSLCAIFAKTGRITSFLSLRKATRLIKQGVGTYAKGLGLIILCSFAFGIFNNIIITCTVKAGIIGISIGALITAIISVYLVYALIAVIAKSVKAECIE